MLLTKNDNLLRQCYADQVIIYDDSTGQTHAFDSNVIEVLNHLSPSKPIDSQQLINFFIKDCSQDEKTMLNTYIQAMIDNLLQLKLIRAYT